VTQHCGAGGKQLIAIDAADILSRQKAGEDGRGHKDRVGVRRGRHAGIEKR